MIPDDHVSVRHASIPMDKKANTCRFCTGHNLRRLASYADYPIFIGCSDKPRHDDALYEFALYLCRDCGGIQQLTLPPLEILYGERRFFGGGRVWQQHYDAFHDFITANLRDGASLLEIGGGTGSMLKRFVAGGRMLRLHDVEPHPEYALPDVTIFRNYFDLDFDTDARFDVIYSSHLIEHLSDVPAFFAKTRTLLKESGSLFTACPNILESFKALHLNAFTTDHFNYFSPPVLAQIAAEHGFVVRRYSMFRDHGMYFEFVAAGRDALRIDGEVRRKAVAELDREFETYIETLNAFAADTAARIMGPTFLYGAHAFTITFLRHLPLGLSYRAVLDNEPTKQWRRLCGTDLQCLPPAVLSEEREPTVLVYMGAYTGEIVEQLKAINPAVRLLRLDEFAAAHGIAKN